MFLHCLKYDFKRTIRDKGLIFWMMAFPIILSTLFNLTLSNIYDNDILRSTIDIAVVAEQYEDPTFDVVLQNASNGDKPLFKAEYMDRETAEKKLKDNDIAGIVFTDDMSLEFSPDGDKTHQTILKEFVDTYRINYTVIIEAYENAPQTVEDVVYSLMSDMTSVEYKSLTNGSLNTIDQYFYNIIAMVAFFGSISGMLAATGNQPNLSKKAARKSVAPTPRIVSIISNLTAAVLAQYLCTAIAASYILFVLGKDLGKNLLLVYVSCFISAFLGVAFGFCIGCFGKMSEGAKTGITMSFTMFCCFLSGLMLPNMKAEVENFAPIINRLNPAALISDLFYCMNVYDDYRVYTERIIIIGVMIVVFTALGFIFTRRRKYASI